MKKVITLMVIFIFAAGITAAFAGDASGHRPASKPISTPAVQGAADHIAQWGESSKIVREESLRTDTSTLSKRRGCGSKKSWF